MFGKSQKERERKRQVRERVEKSENALAGEKLSARTVRRIEASSKGAQSELKERECQLITLNEMVTLFNQTFGHLGIFWVDNANFVILIKINLEVR